jgi:hypothetical protein
MGVVAMAVLMVVAKFIAESPLSVPPLYFCPLYRQPAGTFLPKIREVYWYLTLSSANVYQTNLHLR